MLRSIRQYALSGLALVTTVIAATVLVRSVRSDSAEVAARESVSDWRKFLTDGAWLGSSDARVTVVTFSDFQCPHCRDLAQSLADLRSEFGQQVAVLYRHYPLSNVSLSAAVAAECARREGKFESMHDRLFQEQDSIGIKSWTSFAADAGVRDTVSFAGCLTDESASQVVARDAAAAIALGATGTPTILIRDQLLRGNPGPAVLESIVREMLR